MIQEPINRSEGRILQKSLYNQIIVSCLVQILITSLIILVHYNTGDNTKHIFLFLIIDIVTMLAVIGTCACLIRFEIQDRWATYFNYQYCISFLISGLIQLYVLLDDAKIQQSITLYLAFKLMLQSQHIVEPLSLLLFLIVFVIYICQKFNLWQQAFTYYTLTLIVFMVGIIKVSRYKMARQSDEKQINELEEIVTGVPDDDKLHNLLNNIIIHPFCVLSLEYCPIYLSKEFNELVSSMGFDTFINDLKNKQEISLLDLLKKPVQYELVTERLPRDEQQFAGSQRSQLGKSSHFAKYKKFREVTIPQAIIRSEDDEDSIRFCQKGMLKPEPPKQPAQEYWELTDSQGQQFNVSATRYNWVEQNRVIIQFVKSSTNKVIEELKAELASIKQQDEYKDNLLASVSHDFKTPLNSVLAVLQFLLKYVFTLNQSNGTLDEQTTHYLRVIGKNAHLLLFMIADLLDFSRINKNQLRLCWSYFKIEEVAQEIIDLIAMQAIEKNIKVNYMMTFETLTLYSDPNRIKQILLNLLSNSLKFTNHGSINVEISYEARIDASVVPKQKQTQHRQGLIRISVTDTGVGMPPSVLNRLFNQYATFDHNNGSNKHGVGLGLVICKRLVGMLGPYEKINVESTESIGSSFTFLIYQYMNDDAEANSNLKNSKYFFTQNQVAPRENQTKMNKNSSQELGQSQQVLLFRTPTLNKQRHFDIQHLSKINSMQQMALPSLQSHINIDSSQNAKNDITLKYSIRHDGESIGNDLYIDMAEDGNQSKDRNIQQHIKTRFRSDFDDFIPAQRQESIIESIDSGLISLDQLSNPVDIMKKINPPGTKILVVDDHPFNVMAIKLLLYKFPWIIVDSIYDGRSAIQLAKETQYKYILLDIQMPIMDGYQVVKEIRRMEDVRGDPPSKIIAVTGFDDEKEKQQSLTAGFDAFICKPLKLDGLIEVMKHLY